MAAMEYILASSHDTHRHCQLCLHPGQPQRTLIPCVHSMPTLVHCSSTASSEALLLSAGSPSRPMLPATHCWLFACRSRFRICFLLHQSPQSACQSAPYPHHVDPPAQRRGTISRTTHAHVHTPVSFQSPACLVTDPESMHFASSGQAPHLPGIPWHTYPMQACDISQPCHMSVILQLCLPSWHQTITPTRCHLLQLPPVCTCLTSVAHHI